MQNVRLRVDAWREAERRHKGLALGSPEWREADEDVRSAAKLFRAEIAQASVPYAEEGFQNRSPLAIGDAAVVAVTASAGGQLRSG